MGQVASVTLHCPYSNRQLQSYMWRILVFSPSGPRALASLWNSAKGTSKKHSAKSMPASPLSSASWRGEKPWHLSDRKSSPISDWVQWEVSSHTKNLWTLSHACAVLAAGSWHFATALFHVYPCMFQLYPMDTLSSRALSASRSFFPVSPCS